MSPRVLIEAVEGRKRDTPTWAGSTATPDFPFDPDLLRHVSPIEWKNVILYGEIKIDPAKLKLREPWPRTRVRVMGRHLAVRISRGPRIARPQLA